MKIVPIDATHLNPAPSKVTRPPKSPAVLHGQQQQSGSSTKKIMAVNPPKPPPRPYPLKRSVSAPVSQLKSPPKREKSRDDAPLQIKIYDGRGGISSNDPSFSLEWLEQALEDCSHSPAEEKKEDSDCKPPSHRRGRAFSWDGCGSDFKKAPSTPATVATCESSSPESSPEPSDGWSLCWKLGRTESSKKRGKPPKGSKPSPQLLKNKFSRKVASANRVPPKQEPQQMSRSEVHEKVSSCLKVSFFEIKRSKWIYVVLLLLKFANLTTLCSFLFCLQNGDYRTALSLSENILREDQERYGHHHASVGIALHNIGMVHLHASRYELSESIFYQSVLVRKNALGPEHLDVAVRTRKYCFWICVWTRWLNPNTCLLCSICYARLPWRNSQPSD